jgi:hypothetical protein
MRKDIMFLGIKNRLLAEVWEETCRLALTALGERERSDLEECPYCRMLIDNLIERRKTPG